jgi:PAS domain S-box-containing protein
MILLCTGAKERILITSQGSKGKRNGTATGRKSPSFNRPRPIDGERRTTVATASLKDESLWRRVANSAPVLIWMAGPDKGCTYFNDRWLEFTGRTLKQELGDGWVEGVHPDDLKRCLNTYSRAFTARRSFRMEYRLRRHDGAYRWVLDNGVPCHGPKHEFQGYIGSCVDVTERKEFEALLEMASRFPQENPSPVMRLKQGRVLIFANPAAHQVLVQWHLTLGDEAPRSIAETAVRALSTNQKLTRDLTVGKSEYQIWFVPRGDGGYVNLYFSDIIDRKRAENALLQAHNELEARVRVRTRDLTQANLVLRKEIMARKRVEGALRESEERLRLMIEGTRDYAIYMLDAQGRVATWNVGAEQIKGYQTNEVLGRHFSLFHTHQDIRNRKPSRLLNLARKIGRAEDEGLRIRKDGSRFWGSSIITALRDGAGRLRGFLRVTRDVTERLQAQEALRQTERNLSDFFEQSPLGLFWIGPKGQILRVNKTGLVILGCQPNECLDRSFQEFYCLPEMATSALRRLARGEVLENHRAQLRHKNGTIQEVLIDANGLWKKGRLVHSRWFLRDITRRVELEREVLAIAERERQRIGQDLHDDLCQQLAGIQFLSQTLADRLSADSSNNADRASEIARMVRQTIVHTRGLAHGLSPVPHEILGLAGALQELAARTRKVFGVHCSFRDAYRDAIKDPTLDVHLYRIAQEAVSNALKHGRATRVEIGLTRTPTRLVLTVKDNGVGMPTKQPEEGMGLRLMQYRAGSVHGTLEFRPNTGGGTTVRCVVSEPGRRARSEPA